MQSLNSLNTELKYPKLIFMWILDTCLLNDPGLTLFVMRVISVKVIMGK